MIIEACLLRGLNMKEFMNKDFLLHSETAKTLYHEYAKNMPIYDYHSHLSAKEIAQNKKFKTITEAWLSGDHYKWRAMRSFGISEEYITGNADDKEKFNKWARIMPYLIGNPLYHWTHLELKRYFKVEELLSLETAEYIYDTCNKKLAEDEFSVKALIEKSNVKVLCTTDDPVDSLSYHEEIAKDKEFKTKVLPTFRPDKGIHIEKESFIPWLAMLEEVVGNKINDASELVEALIKRIDYFSKHGCRISDHGMDEMVYGIPSLEIANTVFRKKLNGEEIDSYELSCYKAYILNQLGKTYAKYGWVMQVHIGALRNNNRRMQAIIGPDTGFDSIHDRTFAWELSRFLDDLDATGELPKTILYVLNPRDHYVIGSMIGNFQGGNIPGKIQFGSAWWFCDQKDGMLDQMKALSQLGFINNFVGMLTDSRSFLSFTRHEYFRRILCNLFGDWIENGEYPSNIEFVGNIVRDICYNNAVRYFG